jgi:hypothetical protein
MLTETNREMEEIVAVLGGLRDFDHAEEKLTKVRQTVVIWCLKDFFLNKRFVV